jgi:hypothetical protein
MLSNPYVSGCGQRPAGHIRPTSSYLCYVPLIVRLRLEHLRPSGLRRLEGRPTDNKIVETSLTSAVSTPCLLITIFVKDVGFHLDGES